jgi:hypothetical protein
MRTAIARNRHAVAVMDAAIPAYDAAIRAATPSERDSARRWYAFAGSFSRALAYAAGWSHEGAACVVSAFSPRVRWDTNLRKALAFACGETPKGLRAHVDAARRGIAEGFAGLRALKTHNFARAIAGDREAVVIDVWMCRIAGLAKDAPNVTEYRALADAVRSVAAKHGLDPAEAQALIWVVGRGSAD